MSGPIRPSDVPAAKRSSIPDVVFEAFNELIVEKMSGRAALIMQDDVVARILSKDAKLTRSEIFLRGLLDVEDAYRKQGWHVEYDKPAYNETYPSCFKFTSSQK